MMLSNQHIQQYQNDGFLVWPQFASAKQIQLLRKEANSIIDKFDWSNISIFSTENQTKNTDQYFLESGDKICCFFEENALDNSSNLIVDKHKAINKIGHALHDLNPVFKAFSYQPNILEMALELGFEEPAMLQSMYICKQPNIGGVIHPHQDSTFLYTEPASCTAFWIALEDATVQNACLWGIPASHRRYENKRRYVRKSDSFATCFEGEWADWDLTEMVPIEVKAGDMVIFDGNFVHGSFANTSEQSRHAYVMHLIEYHAIYPDNNWLQRGSDIPLRAVRAVLNESSFI